MSQIHVTNDPPSVSMFRAGVLACMPTIPGYWSIGFAAGAMGTLSGFSIFQIALLAGALYAGSAQFLFYSLWAAGAEMSSVMISVMLINLRYLLMSSSLSPYFRKQSTRKKLLNGLLLTDETFGVAAEYASRHGTLPFSWMSGLNISAWLNWVIASVAGAWLASVVPPSLMEGLSFSLVSMFIGLVLMSWFASKRKMLESFTIITAVILTLFSSHYLDSSVVVMVAAIISATSATIFLRFIERTRS
ncbi:AzlC family ABC transporter permease [Kosakonia pseudosacchari]|uniref:AzlC family ABC transporter permease n=1 Tax=Kosakonia pseudosacchari TaxID=1646340 RepID=UPI000A3A493F|nr:AzlC family ABC transporter permease [Kosakonia pseudosacchari]